MKKVLTHTVITIIVLMVCGQQSNAKDRMIREFDAISNPESVLVPGRRWLPYPEYSDRKGWEELSGPFRGQMIKRGDRYLDYEWKLQRASAYLEYEKTGNRRLMTAEEDNREALVSLLAAELVEGKGRYMNQIVDGVYFLCQQYSWAHGQHTSAQKSGRTLPVYDDAVVSLHGAATGSTLALTHYFLRRELDKLDPSISAGLRREVKRQIIIPYEDDSMDSQHWWKGFDVGDRTLNNWNPFCNYNALLCVLLLEEDRDRLIRTFRRCCESTDKYLDYVKQDGACDEGPSYWGMSCGTLYELLKIMQYSTGGRFDIFDDPMIRRMGEFKAVTWFDGGWVMNFGDGGSREMGGIPLLYRYGKDVGSRMLMDFALAKMSSSKTKGFQLPSALPGGLVGMLFRSLETMKAYPEMQADWNRAFAASGNNYNRTVGNLCRIKSECYPLTEYGIFRNGDWSLAAKGGNNGESHNHNDVGSAVLYVDEFPVLVDPGVGTYIKETFSKKRYTIWYNGSAWHNVPVINGECQIPGKAHKAASTSIDLAGSIFRTDIAGAYPKESGCRKWLRTYKLSDRALLISDEWELAERKSADELHFIVRGEVTENREGELILRVWDFNHNREGLFSLSYPSGYTASVETKEYKDNRLIENWNENSLRRIVLRGRDNSPLKGKSTIKVARIK